MQSKKSLLFVGHFPPQYGGISSHLASLLPDLIDDGYSVTSLSPGVYDGVEHHGNFLNIHLDVMAYFKKNILAITFFAIRNIHRKAEFSFREFVYAIALARKVSQLSNDKMFDNIFFYGLKNSYAIPYLDPKIKEKSKLHMFIFGGLYGPSFEFF